jgi:hypothetical protein
MSSTPLAIMAEEERRYDALPPWAWARPADAIARAEREITAMERLVRESERELADEFGRLSRRIAKHRMSARQLAARLALRRAALERLRETAAD